MKKFLAIVFMLAAFSVASLADQIEKTAVIPAGRNQLSRPFTVASTDFVEANDTITITITNIQKYLQHQTFTYTMDSTSGDPSVSVKAYGKVTSNGSWVQIGSTATWDDEADSPQTISSTTPINYNWLKLEFIASATTQKATLLTVDVRTSNASEVPANSGTLTLSRATSGTVTLTSKDDDSNAALTISAGGTGALTLGDAGSTTAITSSDWAIDATGAATGMGAFTTNGLITGTAGATLSGAAISLNASSNFATNINTGTTNAALTLGGGSGTVAVNSSDWDITTAGVMTGIGAITSDGLFTGSGGVKLVNDGDTLFLNPYKDLHLEDLHVGAASKYSVDSSGNVLAAGVMKPSYFQIGTVVANTDESETLTAAQSGAIVTVDGAATITIPDPSAATVGVVYYLIQTADASLTVTATTANSNSIVCDGVATSDSVAITTSSHQIGAGMIVIGISATKWYVGGLNPESVLTPEAAD